MQKKISGLSKVIFFVFIKHNLQNLFEKDLMM